MNSRNTRGSSYHAAENVTKTAGEVIFLFPPVSLKKADVRNATGNSVLPSRAARSVRNVSIATDTRRVCGRCSLTCVKTVHDKPISARLFDDKLYACGGESMEWILSREPEGSCAVRRAAVEPEMGATVAERLAPRRTGFNPRPGHRTFESGNRAGRCRWSAGFLGDLLFPPPLHSGAAPYSFQSPSSALKTSLLRAAQISSLTHVMKTSPRDAARWFHILGTRRPRVGLLRSSIFSAISRPREAIHLRTFKEAGRIVLLQNDVCSERYWIHLLRPKPCNLTGGKVKDEPGVLVKSQPQLQEARSKPSYNCQACGSIQTSRRPRCWKQWATRAGREGRERLRPATPREESPCCAPSSVLPVVPDILSLVPEFNFPCLVTLAEHHTMPLHQHLPSAHDPRTLHDTWSHPASRPGNWHGPDYGFAVQYSSRYMLCGENTVRQLRALRLAAMAHLMGEAVSPLPIMRLLASNAGKSSRLAGTLVLKFFQSVQTPLVYGGASAGSG
ncbi:hypothetical protein PR048_009535 [Dryococelus australis]|uniref:Uncharacterized protein n=1 Tax=Dryococelus australis TaxID=614101 RepID=A0ABQ9I094_9NEOP|nr:hypothetical protein PR048_009535 [Dryococelus australis]